MKKEHVIQIAPELYLIGATFYYWVLTANLLNPVAIALLLILGFQILSKKVSTGVLIAVIFLLLNLYMVLALISELSEFESANYNYYKLLIFGSVFLGFNLIVAAIMFRNYLLKRN